MKTWIIALAMVAVLGMSGLANAKTECGKKHDKGVHGKIATVDASSFTITTGGKKNPQTLTVKFDANTTVMIDGVAGKLDSSAIGKTCKIVGSNDGTTVTATSITITTKHHHKKPASV